MHFSGHIATYRTSVTANMHFIPSPGTKSPAEGRRPEGEGANLDRRLVEWKHGKCSLFLKCV